MTVYISAPMDKNSDALNMAEVNMIALRARKKFPTAEIIDGFSPNFGQNPLYLLGESLKIMSKADIVYISKESLDTIRGLAEYKIAKDYKYKIYMEVGDYLC